MLRDTLLSRGGSSARRGLPWLVAVLLMLASTLLAACGVTPTGQVTYGPGAAATLDPTATVTTTAPTSTTQPTVAPIPKSSLPTLTLASGWHTVLTLSDTTGAHGDDIAHGSFIASKPYAILYSCKGSGALKILFPDTIVGAGCNAKINRTQTLQPAHPGDSVTITASPNGTIIWELLVSMED